MKRFSAYGLIAALALAGAAPAQAQTNQQYPVDKRHVYSMPGQTLVGLVRSLFPNHSKYWNEITLQFVALNPHAFSDNRTTLMQGTRLEIPSQLREIGFVRDLSGDAWAINFFGRKRQLQVGDSVQVADEVVTAANARISISADDDADISLRSSTSLRFVAYRYEDKGENESVLHLLRGGMRTVTGRIGRGSPSRYRLVTRWATIGIRGTEYGVRLCARGECLVSEGLSVTAAPGMYVAVLQGEIEVRTRPARQTLERGDYYYVASPDVPAQRLYEAPRLIFTPQELASLQQESEPQAALLVPTAAATSEPAPKMASALALVVLLGFAAVVRGSAYARG